MHRRLPALILGGVLLAATAATAIVLLGPPRVTLNAAASDVDHVTLYQNGLAYIEFSRQFTSAGGESMLVIPLPPGARLDSVRIESDDVKVHELRSSIGTDASLREGEQLIVHVRDGNTYRGAYAGGQDGALILGTDDGVVLVQRESITAIEIAGRAPSTVQPGTIEMLVRAEAPAGERTVHVSYLAQGAGWTPSYVLDADTGAFQFYATLTGLDDWHNVTLDLVSGSPNVILQPGPPMPYAADRAFEAGVATSIVADEFGASTSVGELHKYRYGRALEVSRGETVRLLIEEGTLDIVRTAHVVETATGYGGSEGHSQPLRVVERVEVRNTLDEPLPSGRVLAFRGNTWVGEDVLDEMPRGERANLTLSTSMEVKAHLVLEDAATADGRDTYTYALSIENHKDSAIDARAVLTYPTFRTTLTSATPEPDEALGGQVAWNEPIPAGGSATFRIHYETTRT